MPSKSKYIAHFLALLLLVLLVNVLPSLGFFLEDVQMLTFPAFLLWAYSFVTRLKLAVPKWVFVSACALWVFGALHVRGYFGISRAEAVVYLSRLDGSKLAEHKQPLFSRYNEIARTYHLPKMLELRREFESDQDAMSWLSERMDALMLLRGTHKWLSVVLPNQNDLLLRDGLAPLELAPDLKEEAVASGVNLSGNNFLISPSWTDVKFLVGSGPRSFELPDTPPELSRHFLGWLAKGVSKDFEPSEQVDALYRAAGVDGHWRSNVPRAYAYFLLGTRSLIRGVSREQYREFHCAQDLLKKAASKAPSQSSPELSALILNNAAIARIYAAYRHKDFKKAEHWLSKAAGLSDKSGSPVPGARIALFNLKQFRKLGLL